MPAHISMPKHYVHSTSRATVNIQGLVPAAQLQVEAAAQARYAAQAALAAAQSEAGLLRGELLRRAVLSGAGGKGGV